jgi:hypothetical protein
MPTTRVSAVVVVGRGGCSRRVLLQKRLALKGVEKEEERTEDDDPDLYSFPSSPLLRFAASRRGSRSELESEEEESVEGEKEWEEEEDPVLEDAESLRARRWRW